MRRSQAKESRLKGAEKAAILLFCLGEEATAKVFRELDASEVRLISRCMMDMDHVAPEVAQQVMDEYKSKQTESGGLFVRGGDFYKNAILGAVDPEEAERLIDQVEAGSEGRPLETIAMMDPKMVASLLEAEHPQTVALILSTQKAEHTSRIIANLPEDIRPDIMFRIAKTEKVSPGVIAEIEDALQREIGVVVGQERRALGGVDKVVEILAKMEKGADKDILTNLDIRDADMAEEIRKKMFTFDNLEGLDGRALQLILREIDNDTLTISLKTASEEMRDKVFGNISQRAADMIQEDLEAMGPVRLSDVEQKQRVIIQVALKLEDEGRIAIPGRGGKDVLV